MKRIIKKLGKAFDAMNDAGIFARTNFWCCQTCAINAIPDGVTDYCFYHRQDTDDLEDNGSCYLSFGGDAAKIIKILEAHDIVVRWSGKVAERIYVSEK